MASHYNIVTVLVHYNVKALCEYIFYKKMGDGQNFVQFVTNLRLMQIRINKQQIKQRPPGDWILDSADHSRCHRRDDKNWKYI